MITVRKPHRLHEYQCMSCGQCDVIAVVEVKGFASTTTKLCAGCLAIMHVGIGRIVADCKDDQAEVYKEPA